MPGGDGEGETGQEPLPAPFAEHGGGASRGIDAVVSHDSGRFGRMFRDLEPFLPDTSVLEALARSMFPGPPLPPSPSPPRPPRPSPRPAVAAVLEPGDNPDIVSGYTYLGQWVDHDVTYDPTSSLERQNDPNGLLSYRTPRFDLDLLYGSGPVASPHLYDRNDPVRLLVGRNSGPQHEPEDLPRNHQGRAVIPDPRNDVHVSSRICTWRSSASTTPWWNTSDPKGWRRTICSPRLSGSRAGTTSGWS